jgi:phage terminase large subunit-like protein
VYRYQSAEFHYIAFDELTQFWEDEYTYLFSRLRSKSCPDHPPGAGFQPGCPSCRESYLASVIPLRMRAATNPGGIGHTWVRNRFRIARRGHVYQGTNPEAPHIPAFVRDNPFINQQEYEDSLQHLDPVTREQLLRGDWGVSAEGRFRAAWVRRYRTSDDRKVVFLLPDLRGYYVSDCLLFQTVDPAASTREGPGDRDIWRKAPSHTVISTWLRTPDSHLIWWDCRRFRKEIPDTLAEIRRAYVDHHPDFIGIEASGLGIGVYQFAQREGLNVRPLMPRSLDKLVRATPAANRMEQGMIFFPEEAAWLRDVEDEVFIWTGHPAEPADCIDTLAYAAMIVDEETLSPTRLYAELDAPGVMSTLFSSRR